MLFKIFAQILDTKKLPNIPTTNANQHTLNIIFSSVFVLLGAVALFMVVLSGFNYVMARGNPESVEKAKNRLMYAIIGLILASLAYAIVNVFLQRAS